MDYKFEIKSHDGPGRLGKLNKVKTPLLLNINDFTIGENEETTYNIEEEIAEWAVNQTIKKSAETFNDSDIGVIQGSKYIDLRLKCAEKLEEIGYSILLIANSDELLQHPQDLIKVIVSLRENLNPNTFLIFPFAEPSFIPLLSYIGIDGFLDDSSRYYSYLNVLMTPTKNYDLDTYKIYENMPREDIEKFNKNTLDFVLREVRTHMKNRSLRNLVEERSNSSPQNIASLKILDKEYSNFLLKNTQLF